ncbi:MAG TPA: type II CAAX endopeptidase family protein [Candidatus Limnocylindrales bacterium]|nr:type II CAAX endopeptidase family protein [Candidatus Limnocylindrales bacterium]
MMDESRLGSDDTPPKLYGPWAAIIITLGIYFGSQISAGILLAIIPSLLRWTPAQADAWLDSNAWAQFLFVAVAEAITLWLVYKFLKRRQASFADVGLNKPKPRHVVHALTGFGLYFVLYIAGLMVATKLWPGLDTEQKQELGFNTATTGTTLLPIFVSLVILPPITEEIVMRGFLYGSLKTKLTPILSALVASALFAAAHLGEGGASGLLWIAGIDTFILSMVLCYVKDKTGSLWPCIGIHMIKNGLAFVLLFNIVQYLK